MSLPPGLNITLRDYTITFPECGLWITVEGPSEKTCNNLSERVMTSFKQKDQGYTMFLECAICIESEDRIRKLVELADFLGVPPAEDPAQAATYAWTPMTEEEFDEQTTGGTELGLLGAWLIVQALQDL